MATTEAYAHLFQRSVLLFMVGFLRNNLRFVLSVRIQSSHLSGRVAGSESTNGVDSHFVGSSHGPVCLQIFQLRSEHSFCNRWRLGAAACTVAGRELNRATDCHFIYCLAVFRVFT